MRKYDGKRGEDKPTALQLRQGHKLLNLGDYGQLGYISGFPGTMKSTYLRYVIAAGLTGEERLGFKFDLGKRSIISIDTQQPWDIFLKTQSQIEDIAAKRFNKKQYHAYWLTDEDSNHAKRTAVYDIMGKHHKDAGLIIIDVLRNCVHDPNSGDEVTPLIGNISSFAANNNIMVIVVSHRTQTGGQGQTSRLSYILGRELGEEATWGLSTHKHGRYFDLVIDKSRYEPPLPLTVTVDRVNKLLIPEPWIPW